MSYSLGVDLGTTFLAAAVARPTGVRMVTLGEQTVVVPAVVDVTDDGTLVTGAAALRASAHRPDRPVRALKRRMGDPKPVRLGGAGGVTHPVSTLLGAQLRDVVARVIDIEGGAPERIVLTRPASWDAERCDRFRDVARAAGIETPQLVTEAEAAVAAAHPLHDGEIVAVFDLGGGTLEATVVRRHVDGLEVLGAEGVDGVGGIDVDDMVMNYVDRTVGGALSGLDVEDPQTAVALARLRQDCVLAKEALSRDPETAIPVFLPGWHCEVRLTRWTFEEMVRPTVAATMAALSGAVRSSGLISSDLGAVVLMGGSARIPMVREMLSQEFGRPTVEGVHPKYPVALGAAATASDRVPAGSGRGVPPASPAELPGPTTPVEEPSAPAVDGAGFGGARNGTGSDGARNGTGSDGTRNGTAPAVALDAVPPGARNRFDPPTQMLVVPRHELPPPLLPDPTLQEGADAGPRRHRGFGRGTFTLLAAGAAVLVLALVYLFAPGPVPVPPAVPASPPSASAPPPTSAAPPSASTTTSAAPTRSSTTRRSTATGKRTRGAATTTTRSRRAA